MSTKDGSGEDADPYSILSGTTLRVYRFLYREGTTLGVHEVQRGVGLGTASTAHYHLKKLVDAGLVKEKDGGYVVDRILFENMLRIGKSLIPVQTTFVAFFATTLFFLLTLLRPNEIYATYAFALVINAVSLGIFTYQAVVTFKRTTI